jgi:hypothetical protein
MVNPTRAPADCYSHNIAVRQACYAHCTIDTCPISTSYWGYVPSLPANAIFIALFSISTILYVGQAILARRFLGFSIAMISGGILEILGYGGRLWAHYKLWEEVSQLDPKHMDCIYQMLIFH